MSQPTTTTPTAVQVAEIAPKFAAECAAVAEVLAFECWTDYAVIGARVTADWPTSVFKLGPAARDAANELVGGVWMWLVLTAAAELVGGATKEETVSEYEIAYNPDTTEFDLTFRGELLSSHRSISAAEAARVAHAAGRLAPPAIKDQGGRRYALVEQREDGSAVYRAPRARTPLYLSDYAVRLMAQGLGVTIEQQVNARGDTRLTSYRAA